MQSQPTHQAVDRWLLYRNWVPHLGAGVLSGPGSASLFLRLR